MLNSHQIITESVLVILARILLFLSCRKYLLRSLYHDLQGLSSPGAALSIPASGAATPTRLGATLPASGDGDENGIELGSLPTPVTGGSTKKMLGGIRQQHPLHSTVSRTAFAVCFVESSIMFILLICQGMDILLPSTRLFHWRLSIFLLLATILVIVPLCVSVVLTIGSPSSLDTSSRRRSLFTPKILLSLIPVGLYLFALSRVPLPARLPAESTSDAMSTALARLLVIGTLILGLLSGFGAVSNVRAYFPGKSASGAPSQSDVDVAERSLARIRADTDKLKAELERRDASQAQAGGSSSWFSRVIPTLRGDSSIQELQGLEALEYQMARNVQHLRARHATAQYDGTLRGRILNYGGRVFAVYCVIRIFSSCVNLFRHQSPNSGETTVFSSTDMMARLIGYGLALSSHGKGSNASAGGVEAAASIARQISLALVGVIILSSVRLVLRGVTRMLRVTSRNLGASLMLLILTQLMGIYLLSTVVQLRTTFPPPPSSDGIPPDNGTHSVETVKSVNLFSTMPDAEVFGWLFDFAVVASAGVSAVVAWGARKMNGVGDE